MTRLGLWLLAAASGGKQNGPLRIPLPFEDAVRAALEIRPKPKATPEAGDPAQA
jgi:hypothetical protein